MRRRKEVEDPNNTWDMQLMAAVCAKALATADELLLKGAHIEHFASHDISTLPAGCTGVAAAILQPLPSVAQQQQSQAPQPPGTAGGGSGGANATAGGDRPAGQGGKSAGAAAGGGAASAAGAGAAGGGAVAVTPNPDGTAGSAALSAAEMLLRRNSAAITPFIAAILSEDIETATWVAAHGGNPNAQFNNGQNGTVLHYLVRVENAALLELVCQHRAEIDPSFSLDTVEGATNLTPVKLALALKKPEMARILIRFGCVNPFTELIDGTLTSTQYAVVVGDLSTVETNLNAGDNIRQKSLAGQTLLHLALLQPSVFELLLEHGLQRRAFNINSLTNSAGETPLIFAIKHLSGSANTGNLTPRAALAQGNGASGTGANPPATPPGAAGALNAASAPTGAWSVTGIAAALAGGTGLPALYTPVTAEGLANNSNTAAAIASVLGVPCSAKGIGQPRPVLEVLDWLVAKGADPNTPDATPFGLTPLMHAILVYNPEIIKRLIQDLKVDVNARDRAGATAVHYAVSARLPGTLDLLCSMDLVDLNAADRLGETPLHRACIRGYVSAIQRLLASQYVNVNARDIHGRNALHVAVQHRQRASVECLVKRCGPDVGVPPAANEKGKKQPTGGKKGQAPPEPVVPLRLNTEAADDQQQQTPLQMAIITRQWDIAAILVEQGRCSVLRPAPHGTLLHEVVAAQHLEMVQLLLRHGSDVLARNSDDCTALHLACGVGRIDVVPSAAVATSLCEATDPVPTVPRMVRANVDIVSVLLQAGAILNDQSLYTLDTPLHLACAREHVRLVETLLTAGAAVNISNSALQTPLHLAASGLDAQRAGAGTRTMVGVKGMRGFDDHLLSEAASSLRAKVQTAAGTVADGEGAFSETKRGTSSANKMGSLGNDDDDDDVDFGYADRAHITRLLLEHGANPRARDVEGRLPLHVAAATANVECVTALMDALEGGRSSVLLSVDERGWTPLHVAVALGGSVECVAFLLSQYEQLPGGTFGSAPLAGPAIRGDAPALGDIAHLGEKKAVNSNQKTTSIKGSHHSSNTDPATGMLTLQTCAVLAALRRQDHRHRTPMLLAVELQRSLVGRFLVKYTKERQDRVASGSLRSPASEIVRLTPLATTAAQAAAAAAVVAITNPSLAARNSISSAADMIPAADGTERDSVPPPPNLAVTPELSANNTAGTLGTSRPSHHTGKLSATPLGDGPDEAVMASGSRPPTVVLPTLREGSRVTTAASVASSSML